VGTAPGRLWKANAYAVSQSFTYDGPLLTSEQTAWSNVNASVSVGFGVNAKLQPQTEGVSVTTSGATNTSTATYDYDPDGLLTCASLSTCSPGAASKLELTRDPTTGALLGTTFGAVSDTYTWNAYGELASHSAQIGTNPPFYKVTYDPSGFGRDGFGRVMREIDQSGNIRDYWYDEQGRLSLVGNGSFVVRWYTYDLNGNRLSTSASSQTPIATYDDQDRLTSYEGTTYQYWGGWRASTQRRPWRRLR